MIKFLTAVFLLCFNQMLLAQDLYVGSNSYLTIESGASIAISGLVLSPTADYSLNSNTSISRLSTAANTGNISILRQFTFSQTLTNFLGAILFHYEDSELNGLVESELVLKLFDANGVWRSFEATLDTSSNRMAYTFNTGIDFSIITADDMDVLNLETPFPLSPLRVYPNPTNNMVHIDYPYAIRTSVYNTIGQLLQKSSSYSIDLSLYESATYFLTIEDLLNQTTKTIKVIKK